MSTLEEIGAAIEALPREQFFRLVTRLRKKFEDEWDGQAGRLDALAREAVAEYRAGRTRPFPADESPCDR